MTWDFSNGGRLLLAGGGLAWLWILAAVVALVLLVILYLSERRLVSKRAGLTLLALRVMAAAVLVLALFEPITSWSREEKIRGRVIIAADVSESMDTLEQTGQASQSRRSLANSLVSGERATLKSLDVDHEVRTLTFAETTSPEGTLNTLAERLKVNESNGTNRRETNWSGVLSTTLKTPDDVPVLGLILLTDGRQNIVYNNTQVLEQLKMRQVPIYSVLIGSTVPPKDVAIAKYHGPDSVFKGDIATIDIDLKADGYPAGFPLEVTLTGSTISPQKQTIKLTKPNSRPRVSFKIPLEKTGTATFKATVNMPVDDQRKDNQDHSFAIRVADDKANVLLVDGEARWEFRYLRNALIRDSRVTVESTIFQQPPSTNASDSTYSKSLPPLVTGINVVDPLNRFDMIVLGDAELSTDQWTRLERYVSERGGTLVFLPGPKFWPAQSNLNDSVRSLLPINNLKQVDIPSNQAESNTPLPAGIKLFPVSGILNDSANWPMLQLGSTVTLSRQSWSQLPPLPWVLGGRAKPGTTTLIASNAEGTDPVMAVMSYGLGKTLWMGTDATWRWRHRIGDTIHHRFWGQIVRWASADKLEAGNKRVRFGTKTPRVQAGENYKIQARIGEQVPTVGPGFLIAARIVKAGTDETIVIVPLRELPNQPKLYEATGPLLPEGDYSILLDTPSLPSEPGDTDNPQASLTVALRDTSERIELTASRDALDQLAAATDGRVFTIENSKELPSLLRSKLRTNIKVEETRLWDHPVGLILFLSIVCFEWIIRKRVGLP